MADLHLTGCVNNAPCELLVPFEWGRSVAATQLELHWDSLLAVLSALTLASGTPRRTGTVLVQDH